MERNITAKRLIATALALVLLLTLVSCGGQKKAEADGNPSDTLKGIYEALISPDSAYSQNKAIYVEYYPELEFAEALKSDRIILDLKANGNEYFTDTTSEFVQKGDRLTATVSDEDYTNIMNVIYVANAVGAYFGMETDLVSGYLNGLSVLKIESDNFIMTEGETAGTTTFSLNIAEPWDMKELDQMVLNEKALGDETLNDDYTSQGGSIGKIRFIANGNVNGYTVLLAEFGELDDIAYQSIINLVTLRKPAGYEAFLTDFTELKDLEAGDYTVDLEPDDDTIGEIMGERDNKFRYMLVRFGSDEFSGGNYVGNVPDADSIADFYFRIVAGIPWGTAGSSLKAAQAACNVLEFASDNTLWLANEDTLIANIQEAWESLTDSERENFSTSILQVNDLLTSCFDDWDANRDRFDDAGVSETMERLIEDGTSQWSWDALAAYTLALGSDE